MGVSLLVGARTPDRDQDGFPDYDDGCPDYAGKRAAKGRPAGCPPLATFIGFSVAAEAGTTVSVHSTDVALVEVSEGGRWVSLLLKGAFVRDKDSWSPPPGSSSVLERADLLQDAAGARLNLHLKTRMSVSFLTTDQTDGIVIEVEIPPVQ